MVVRGAPGSGRSTLLGTLTEAAAATALVVPVAGRAVRSDRRWSGLDAVVRPLRRHIPQLLPNHEAAIREAIGQGTGEPILVGNAVLALLGLVADDRPVVVAVDDLDALDASSVDALLFASRRLFAEGVVVVATVAAGTDVDLDGVEVLDLGPVSAEDARRILRRASGRNVAPDVVDALLVATGGNPAQLVGVATRLRPQALAGLEPLPEPLPIAPVLTGRAEAVASDLPSSTRQALAVLAALHDLDADAVDLVLRELSLDRRDLGPSVTAGLVVDDGGRHHFVDDAARVACASLLDGGTARAVHAAIATVLRDRLDADRHALHLALATDGPDAGVAELVAEAASLASARFAFDVAAQLWEHAARLDDDASRAAGWLLEAASAAHAGGAADHAADLARRVPSGTDPVVHARAVLLERRASGAPGTVEELRSEAANVATVDPRLAIQLLVDATGAALLSFNAVAALETARQAHDLAVAHAPDMESITSVALGGAQVANGRSEGRAALRSWPTAIGTDVRSLPILYAALEFVLVWAELFDEARTLIDLLIEAGRAQRLPSALPGALTNSAIVSFSTGEWDRMEADILEAVELAEAMGATGELLRSLHVGALFLALRGRPEWRAWRDRAETLAGQAMPRGDRLRMAATEGTERFGAGDAVGAIAVLEPGVALDTSPNPGALLIRCDLAEAHLLAGDRARAMELLDEFEAQALASQHQRSIARASAVRGALTDRREDGDPRFDRAEEILSDPHIPFVLARVRLLRARWLAHIGDADESRTVAASALTIFEHLGAPAWAEQARALADAPPPPSDRDRALTPDERRVVDAVVGGASIADVAARLFRSPQTVERHLATALAKLGVTNREALRRAVGDAVADGGVVVTLLGRFAVQRGEASLTPPPGVVARLLQVVALAGGTLHVDEVIEALWPDSPAEKARGRLRTALARLRRGSGPLLVRAGDLIVLAPDVEVDVLRFRAEALEVLGGRVTDAAEAETIAMTALGRFGGDLLPESIYEAWTTAPRERLRRDRLALLDLVVGWRLERGALDEAIVLLEMAIDLDPYDESRYVRLGRALLDAGRRGPAAAAARRGRQVANELGLEPSADLVAIEAEARAPTRR